MSLATASLGGDESVALGSKRSRPPSSLPGSPSTKQKSRREPSHDIDLSSLDGDSLSLSTLGGDESVYTHPIVDSTQLPKQRPSHHADDDLANSSLGTTQTDNTLRTDHSTSSANDSSSSASAVNRSRASSPLPQTTHGNNHQKIENFKNATSLSGALSS